MKKAQLQESEIENNMFVKVIAQDDVNFGRIGQLVGYELTSGNNVDCIVDFSPNESFLYGLEDLVASSLEEFNSKCGSLKKKAFTYSIKKVGTSWIAQSDFGPWCYTFSAEHFPELFKMGEKEAVDFVINSVAVLDPDLKVVNNLAFEIYTKNPEGINRVAFKMVQADLYQIVYTMNEFSDSEVIEEGLSREEAEYLLGEYQLAFQGAGAVRMKKQAQHFSRSGQPLGIGDTVQYGNASQGPGYGKGVIEDFYSGFAVIRFNNDLSTTYQVEPERLKVFASKQAQVGSQLTASRILGVDSRGVNLKLYDMVVCNFGEYGDVVGQIVDYVLGETLEIEFKQPIGKRFFSVETLYSPGKNKLTKVGSQLDLF